MTNEQKYKTADERAKAFRRYCDNMKCSQCLYGRVSRLICPIYWLADEYKKPKQDLPFILKTEVRTGCVVSTICSFDGKEVISCHNVIGDDKAYCDSLNAAALAWHKRMNEKEGSNG